MNCGSYSKNYLFLIRVFYIIFVGNHFTIKYPLKEAISFFGNKIIYFLVLVLYLFVVDLLLRKYPALFLIERRLTPCLATLLPNGSYLRILQLLLVLQL